jgi:hypothetical protein
LQRLALEDQRQAEEGLVALTSNGKMFYKLVEELTEGDMAARIAADRLREAWLSRSGGTGSSITGEAPKGKAARSNLRWRVLRTYSMCRVSSCLAISLRF